MWGHLCTELSSLYNFNVGFSTHKSEILIHLSQWQYWWWFWFSFFWTFYFFVLLRVVKHRVFKMNLRINTSFRSRGKWGDYLVTLIPLSWCLNILLNSNFILRMIEWQAESGSLIIRIHGKQWYWVYKYDLQNVSNIDIAPKSVGYSKWTTKTQEGSTLFNKYLDLANIKISNLSQNEYWTDANLRDVNKTSTFTATQGQQNSINKPAEPITPQKSVALKVKATKEYSLKSQNKTRDLKKLSKLPFETIQLNNSFLQFKPLSNKEILSDFFTKRLSKHKTYNITAYKLEPEKAKEILTKLNKLAEISVPNNFEKNTTSQKTLWDNIKHYKKNSEVKTVNVGQQNKKTCSLFAKYISKKQKYSINRYKLNPEKAKEILAKLNKLAEINVPNNFEKTTTSQKTLWDNIKHYKKNSEVKTVNVGQQNKKTCSLFAKYISKEQKYSINRYKLNPEKAKEILAKLNKLAEINVPNNFEKTTTSQKTLWDNIKHYKKNPGQIENINSTVYKKLNNTHVDLKNKKALKKETKLLLFTKYVNENQKYKLRAYKLNPQKAKEILIKLNKAEKINNSTTIDKPVTSQKNLWSLYKYINQDQKESVKLQYTNKLRKTQVLSEKALKLELFLIKKVETKETNKQNLVFYPVAERQKYVKKQKVLNLFTIEKNVKQPTLSFYDNSAIDDAWEVYSNLKLNNSNLPCRVVQTPLNVNNLNSKKLNLFSLRYLENTTTTATKPSENIEYLVIKQKRYKRKQGYKHLVIPANNGRESFPTNRFLKNNLIFKQVTNTNAENAFNFYSAIKLNRKRSEMFSINLSRRLLRTTRTLVLPAYTNISIIANSYDVVHSWFIPGLGIKIDCVPGKSTHHSLYIDNIGLYYGQCAEICGRYHHHMPIRICAIPFDHFMIWWISKGLPKILKTRYNPKKIDTNMLLKYTW